MKLSEREIGNTSEHANDSVHSRSNGSVAFDDSHQTVSDDGRFDEKHNAEDNETGSHGDSMTLEDETRECSLVDDEASKEHAGRKKSRINHNSFVDDEAYDGHVGRDESPDENDEDGGSDEASGDSELSQSTSDEEGDEERWKTLMNSSKYVSIGYSTN